MGRPRKTQTQPEVAEATGTVQYRRRLEQERQQHATQLRQHQAKLTTDAQKETKKRIESKPEDSRTLVEPDPVASLQPTQATRPAPQPSADA